MRSWISIACAAVLGALLVASAFRAARTMRLASSVASAPGALRPAIAPAVWVFVRPGCGRCAAHLEALDAAWSALATTDSARLAGRVQIVGACERPPRGATLLPHGLDGVHVPLVPTTWFWNGRGEVIRVWRGARDTQAWTPALRQLAAQEAA